MKLPYYSTSHVGISTHYIYQLKDRKQNKRNGRKSEFPKINPLASRACTNIAVLCLCDNLLFIFNGEKTTSLFNTF